MQITTHNDRAAVSRKQSSLVALHVTGSIAVIQARRQDGGQPRKFTACVSEISWCPPRPAYHQAVKSFAEVYAAYQAYLIPVPHVAPVYEVSAQVHPSHCGCLSDELADCVSRQHGFDDDVIEDCGYFGWLQRY